MKSDTQLKMTVARFLIFCFFFFKLSTSLAARNDVLIIVNDNSIDSPQIGSYYAQQRGIDPANIVHINVPDSYFISWSDFRLLRDQLIHFMQLNTLDDPALLPVTCIDGEPPYYCAAAMDQLRAHTRIRYLVTTRGVPTRMTVDGSTLFSPNAPTSVDNYLKYWLINYFTNDVKLSFSEREIAFGDGRGMRLIVPATDRELIVGRIDGLDLNAANALIDRALAVEGVGIYGRWHGSTKFWRWRDANAGNAIYPKSGSSLQGWRYTLGLWGEDRAVCSDYLNFSGFLSVGKAPAVCQVQFNDNSDPGQQSNQGISYPAPGNASSRMPQVIDALGYQGWLDGQAALGSFAALLNWRKNDQCTVTLCDSAADPAVCRANSSDIFGELNTDCVGVADGFMAYNHQSWPVSYLAVWPTSWFQSTSTGSSGWNDAGHGDVNQLAFPEVRNDEGFDDINSLWFRNTDQIVSPSCYASSDFSGVATVPCDDQRRLVLSQKILLTPQTLDPNNPQTYRVSLRYRTFNIPSPVSLQARLFIHETGAGNAQIDYGVQILASLTPVDTAGWATGEVLFTLDPLRHTTNSFDGIKITFDTPNAFAGDLGIDVVSVKEITSGQELVSNGSFSQGHRQMATGDHAAIFLNRLGGVAAWGSVGHHQSGGSAFGLNGLESMVYFLRGLPLGDAVWFDESNNSGLLYGDPLYSPVAVRLNPVNSNDLLGSSSAARLPINLFGSTVNGRNAALVSTNYRIDICPGDDFFTCDQAQSWLPTGISGQGGNENVLLGTLDTTSLTGGRYTLRLQVTSLNKTSGRSQTINDYYVAAINDPPVAIDGNIKTLINVDGTGALTVNDDNVGTLTYSIVSNTSKGTVFLNSVTGAYQYRPNPGITGIDSFTFKANDGMADSNIATITVKISTTNAAPVANAGILATSENVAANGFLNASDIDGDILTYGIVSNATKGTVTITDAFTGSYTYTPVANASGSDSFVFNVNDGLAVSNAVTVSIIISPVNIPPVANASVLMTSEDVVVNGFLNASDVNGDNLIYSIVTNATKGNVLITDTATGAYTYTPALNNNGSDSFTFKANDGLSDSNLATVNVTIAAVNDRPVAQPSNLNTDEDVAANSILIASDIDGDILTYSIISNGSKGTAVITNTTTGAYSYTPDANANGTDSFTFNVTDGVLVSNTVTVSVNIAALNDAPTAQDTVLDVTEDFAANAILSGSDIDGDSLSYRIVTNGSMGTAVITNASTGAFTYTPNANASGIDSFTFKVSDGLLDSVTATVTVSIAQVNDAPVVRDINFSLIDGVSATDALGAFDVDDDKLTYLLASNPAKGKVTINTADGIYTYLPNPGATGTDSFTYIVSDGQANSNVATVTIQLASFSNGDSGGSSGSLNMFFILVLSLLSGLRFFFARRV